LRDCSAAKPSALFFVGRGRGADLFEQRRAAHGGLVLGLAGALAQQRHGEVEARQHQRGGCRLARRLRVGQGLQHGGRAGGVALGQAQLRAQQLVFVFERADQRRADARQRRLGLHQVPTLLLQPR
jgi:hypothetical protein